MAAAPSRGPDLRFHFLAASIVARCILNLVATSELCGMLVRRHRSQLEYHLDKSKLSRLGVKTFNEVYSSPSARRRYEVWFVRVGLADGSGAWWFRYLLFNLGRDGCLQGQAAISRDRSGSHDPQIQPIQVWATWFPTDGKPQSFIEGFSQANVDLSGRGSNPFHFIIGANEIDENSCRGALAVGGHHVCWDLRYRSTFRVTLSTKGWIGFSRTPHSDAVFSGQVTLNGRKFEGAPLGYGVQGHNCGYRHRGFWTWAHAYFPRPNGRPSTLEALTYDMPLGLVFQKAVLWHEGKQHVFGNFKHTANSFVAGAPALAMRHRQEFRWSFRCSSKDGLLAEVVFEGGGPSIHHLPYFKTDCSGSFEVMNNSLARAFLRVQRVGAPVEELESSNGAVLERAAGG